MSRYSVSYSKLSLVFRISCNSCQKACQTPDVGEDVDVIQCSFDKFSRSIFDRTPDSVSLGPPIFDRTPDSVPLGQPIFDRTPDNVPLGPPTFDKTPMELDDPFDISLKLHPSSFKCDEDPK